MIEHRTRFKNLLGIGLLLVGLSGATYLAWIYLIWGQSLPKFDLQADYQSPFTPGGFGALLPSGEQPSVPDLTLNSSPDVPLRESVDLNRSIDGLYERKFSDGIDANEVYLSIPKLNIERAAVRLDVEGSDEQIYDTVLTEAIAHLKNSAYPGKSGNAFLFGHSKLPIFAGTDYESIFTNLPKMKNGDIIRVDYKGYEYTYQVGQVGVVEPSDVFILNQPESKKMLTLMTCIPPGFATQRYITVSELIGVKQI
jgi:sortase A